MVGGPGFVYLDIIDIGIGSPEIPCFSYEYHPALRVHKIGYRPSDIRRNMYGMADFVHVVTEPVLLYIN
jgi:hypothetical protein